MYAIRSYYDEASQKSLRELETIAEQTIENLRRTTQALRPIYLDDLKLVKITINRSFSLL